MIYCPSVLLVPFSLPYTSIPVLEMHGNTFVLGQNRPNKSGHILTKIPLVAAVMANPPTPTGGRCNQLNNSGRGSTTAWNGTLLAGAFVFAAWKR